MHHHAPPVFALSLALLLTTSACSSEPDQTPKASQDMAEDQNSNRPLDMTYDQTNSPDLGPDLGEDMPAEMTSDMRADQGPDMLVDPQLGDPLLYSGEVDGRLRVFTVNTMDGRLNPLADLKEGDGRMSFLAFHPSKPLLFSTWNRQVRSFNLDAQGRPGLLDTQDALDNGGGTHLTTDREGDWLFVVSYNAGELASLPIESNGEIGMRAQRFGGDLDMDFCKNAHQARMHPDNSTLYIPCLGSDHIAVLRFAPDTGALTALQPVSTQQGAGPRHMDFAPDAARAYVLNELDSTVNAYQIQADGQLSEIQSVSTLPAGQMGASKSSDIKVASHGRWLYAVNREPRHDIAIFDIANDGKLSLRGHVSSGGQHARTITVDQELRWLYAGNTNSRQIAGFTLQNDGGLSPIETIETQANLMFVGLRYLPAD